MKIWKFYEWVRRNLIGRWASPNIPHARCTHSEVELRKCCLGQSENSEIPYHLIVYIKPHPCLNNTFYIGLIKLLSHTPYRKYYWGIYGGFHYIIFFIKLNNFFFQISLQDKYNIGVLTVNIEFMWLSTKRWKYSLKLVFPHFEVSPHKFYINRQYTNIAYLVRHYNQEALHLWHSIIIC